MMGTAGLLSLRPEAFVEFLKEKNISRFSFVYDEKENKLASSHSEFQPIADFIHADTRDFKKHEGLFFQVSKHHDVLQGVFVHKTARGQASGGVRFWHYDTLEDYMRDGLRLSAAMTQKIALAGLWWGGGKGVMTRNPNIDCSDPDVRASVYRDFGELCTRLKGCFVAAEDVGTNVTDMGNIFARTRFTTCIPKSLGGSGNPSILTAKGVLCGMEAALEFMSGETLEGKTVAVQGMGNVGGALIKFLLEENVRRIIAVDINSDIVNAVKKEFPQDKLQASVVQRGDDSIAAADCDILSLNATGAVVNPQIIPRIRASVICGGANNQLEDAERDGLLLHKRGVVFIPDFLANRMGIVNCANEQYGVMVEDPYIQRHLGRDWEHSIHKTVLRVLQHSKETGVPPGKIAADMADKLAEEKHPIFGHRGKEIISRLAQERWHEDQGVSSTVSRGC